MFALTCCISSFLTWEYFFISSCTRLSVMQGSMIAFISPALPTSGASGNLSGRKLCSRLPAVQNDLLETSGTAARRAWRGLGESQHHMIIFAMPWSACFNFQVTEHFRDLPKHLGVLHVRCTQLSSHCNATALIHTIIHAA